MQGLQHALRVADGDAELDGRVALVVAPHRVHDVEGAGGADAQAALAQVAGVAQAEFDLGFLLHQFLDQRHQAVAGVR
ncbi:Uncharacterised protein [Bordetella pertussis]|nr:Uncharacterised protein [Bordetella pertussis]